MFTFIYELGKWSFLRNWCIHSVPTVPTWETIGIYYLHTQQEFVNLAENSKLTQFYVHLIALQHDPLSSIFWLQLNCLSQMGKFKFHPPLCMNLGRNLEQINISHFILFSGAIISRIFTFIYELGKWSFLRNWYIHSVPTVPT